MRVRIDETYYSVTNYNDEDVVIQFDALKAHAIENPQDFSLTQDLIKNALRNPHVVFEKHLEEIYAVSLGKSAGVVAVYVIVAKKERSLKEIKLFSTMEEANGIGMGYAIRFTKGQF